MMTIIRRTATPTTTCVRSRTFASEQRTIYATYAGPHKSRFKWLPTDRFMEQLAKDLRADVVAPAKGAQAVRRLGPARDAKLDRLADLLSRSTPEKKSSIFTQFADTVIYLTEQLKSRGIAESGGRYRRHR